MFQLKYIQTILVIQQETGSNYTFTLSLHLIHPHCNFTHVLCEHNIRLWTTGQSAMLWVSVHHYWTKCVTAWDLFSSTSVGVWGAVEGDPLLLGTPFVVVLLTVLRKEEERPCLTVGHAPVLLATTGPKDTGWPGLYWLGSPLAVAALAPCHLPIQNSSRAFIKALKKLWIKGCPMFQ